jgi:hypothetical protein
MSPPGGRRPVVTRGVFAIEDQELLLPNPIALDTSFVVEVCRVCADVTDPGVLVKGD